MDPVNAPAKFEARSFIRSWEAEIIAIEVLGVANHNLGEDEVVWGSGKVPVERALVSSYIGLP